MSLLLSHIFVAGEHVLEDRIMFPEISGFDAAFDHNSIMHYVHRDREDGDLMYSKYDTMLNSLTQLEDIVVAPVPLQDPQLTVGDSKILLSFRYRAIGMYSTIDGRYIHLDNDSLSSYMIIGPDNGFTHNSWHTAIHTSADQFLVSWVAFEGTSSPLDEGVRLRILGEEMSELTPAFINDSLGEISSPTQLCYSPISEVSLLTWSENSSVLYGQIVGDEGNLLGESFEIAADTTVSEFYYHKTINIESGGFIVFWVESFANVSHIYSRKYDASGFPISAKLRLDPEGSVFWDFAVARENSGQMILLLNGRFPANGRVDVYAQRLDHNAEYVGGMYKITSSESGQPRAGIKVLLQDDKVYTFWREELELWANISSYTDPPTSNVVKRPLVPAGFRINAVYPNPFNPATTIEYDLPKPSEVSLVIYDVTGREVQTLVSRSQTIGRYQVSWNGTDETGTPVTSGIYMISFSTPDFRDVKKAVLIR